MPDFNGLPDGTFRAEDIPPGNDRLEIPVRSHFSPRHQTVQFLADGNADLAVPATPACPNEIVPDLGKIETRRS